MPILVLQLEYDKTSNVKSNIVINGSIPKQPLELVHYCIKLSGGDTSLDYLPVKLPFLNDFDVNTNFSVSNAFPIFNDSTRVQYDTECSYLFNPSQNINQNISSQDWEVYAEDGTVYENKDYTITLVFNYRRQDLV